MTSFSRLNFPNLLFYLIAFGGELDCAYFSQLSSPLRASLHFDRFALFQFFRTGKYLILTSRFRPIWRIGQMVETLLMPHKLCRNSKNTTNWIFGRLLYSKNCISTFATESLLTRHLKRAIFRHLRPNCWPLREKSKKIKPLC